MKAALVRLLGRPLATTGPEARPDAIVVLGAPLRADGTLTEVLAERVRAGVELWQRGAAPILCMTGGMTRDAPTAEAAAMAAVAAVAGVPETALLVEPAALTTHENARNVARILLPQGKARVLLVTQPFHLRRARMWFRHYGLDARGWLITDSLQFRAPRALRWVLREYLCLMRDALRLRE